MARFSFDLATKADDASLRRLLHRIEMPGRIGLKLLRDPSFFDGNDLSGDLHQTMICRDGEREGDGGDGSIVGFGCRSVRAHFDPCGNPRTLGYLHMLRSEERVRSGLLLARGYRFLRDLHGDGATHSYLTTIAEGNDVARRALTSGRAGLPTYRPEGDIQTFAIASRTTQHRHRAPGIRLVTAADTGIDPVLGFFTQQAPHHRHLPCYTRDDFGPQAKTFRGMALADISVAIDRRDQVVGTLALWDQRLFRQTVVTNYDRALAALRPIYNLHARLRSGITLPPAGSVLDYATAALTVVAPGRGDVADMLLRHTQRMAHERSVGYFLAGFHHSSPWVRSARSLASQRFSTSLYHVSWNNGGPGADAPWSGGQQQAGVPYVEVGVL